MFAGLALLAALLPAPATHAATIGVTTGADSLTADGACSLREAIQAANTDAAVDTCAAGSGADLIVLPPGTYTLTRAGPAENLNQTGDLDIRSAITIQSVDKNTTTIDATALGDRIFEVHPGAVLVLTGLALGHGGDSTTADFDGGAIFNAGSATLANVDVAHSAAGRNGGAIFNQAGTLVVAGSIVRDNTAGVPGQSDGAGGGIYTSGGNVRISNSIVNNNSSTNGYGGGIRTTGLLAIDGSWIHDNTTNTRGGGIYSTATTIITSTVLDSNRAGHDGGNIYSGGEPASALRITSSELRSGQARYGGAIYSDGALALASVSLALNSADTGGAIYSAALASTAQLVNLTIAGNTHEAAAPGAAITNIGAALIVRNSLLGTNGSAGSCAGAIVSAGHNLDAGASCGFSATGDMPNTDPLLGALPVIDLTPNTFPLLAGSPAINAGDNAGCAALDIHARARPHGSACDIGAYEINTAPTAAADAYSTAEDTPLLVAAPGLLANDADPDQDPLSAQRVDWPTLGQLTLGADGSFSYTPPPNFAGSDQFAYRASDGALGTEVRVVTISITPVNDPPLAHTDSTSTAVITPLLIPTATLLANDTDIEGDGLFMTAVSTSSAYGGAAVLVGAHVRYTPPLGFSGTDSFSYTVDDGHAGTATGTVQVQVQIGWLFLPIARR